MKPMFKSILAVLMLTAVAEPVFAVDIGEENGQLEISLKAIHLLDALDNGFEPNTGSSELFAVRYQTPSKYDLQFGIGGYLAGDFFNLTKPEGHTVAAGLFINESRQPQEVLGEFYLDYTPENYRIYGGRMIYRTPLTENISSTMPAFHTVFGVSVDVSSNLKLGLAQMTEMAFGARGTADWGLINEGLSPGTAGAAVYTRGPGLGEGIFHSISEVTLGSGQPKTNGVSIFNAEYNASDNLELSVWNYYAENISNSFYLQANQKVPLKNHKLKLNAQYLTQTDQGDQLAGNIDYNLLGLKATLSNAHWQTYVAVNHSSGPTSMLNAWAGDPGFTSSVFSRNEYRKDVNAYKLGGLYKITSHWMVFGSYANYGKSNSLKGDIQAAKDATEIDLALIWKPVKKAQVKLFHAIRTTEYDGVGGIERKQGHISLIASYTF